MASRLRAGVNSTIGELESIGALPEPIEPDPNRPETNEPDPIEEGAP